MLDQDLKNIWQRAGQTEFVNLNEPQLLTQLKPQIESFQKEIATRDAREIQATFLLMPAFAIIAYFVPNTLSKIGAALIIPYCLLVIYMLKQVKKYKVSDFNLPIKDYLKQYYRYVAKEMRLMQTVAFWYILPPAISLTLFFTGLEENKVQLAFTLIALAAAYLGIIMYNFRSVNKDFKPLLARINDQIKALESND